MTTCNCRMTMDGDKPTYNSLGYELLTNFGRGRLELYKESLDEYNGNNIVIDESSNNYSDYGLWYIKNKSGDLQDFYDIYYKIKKDKGIGL